jgi:ribonuclease BN (tRNA processing enzyme)
VLAARRDGRAQPFESHVGGEIAAAADPGLLVLTHLYPMMDRLDLPALVGARWPGRVVVAHDGWSVELAPAGT